jgi:hypothetical protein
MKYNEEIQKIQNELLDTLSVSVKINYEEKLKLIVNDLHSKYKSAIQRKDNVNINLFKSVLVYYIGDSDFNDLISNDSKV